MSFQKKYAPFFVCCTLALLLTSCRTMHQQKSVVIPPGFDWQGHRGCRGLLPENSIPAFLKALEFPQVTTLELDLAVSKDFQLIVSHEPWFNPAICTLPNGDSIPKKDAEKYLIYQMTVDEIARFDCGSKGNPRFREQQPMPTHKPTLKAVVEAVRKQYPGKNVRWNIEIKSQPEWDGLRHPPVDQFAGLVIDEIKALGIAANCTVQSFDVRALQSMHRLDPAIRLAFLVENLAGMDKNMEKLGFKPDIYSPYYVFVNKKMIKKCHDSGIQVIPWTVNDASNMRKLITLGVDGIITDYPNLIW